MSADTEATKAAHDELRMNAYYYSFDRTGVYEIDRLLSAVAVAGKRFHHTEFWNDADEGDLSAVDRIQAAANDAAAVWRRAAVVETGEEPKFRKRPVVVQAIQYDPQNPLDVMLRWVPQVNDGVVAEMRTDGDRLIISTLEGDMAAEPGDWIIRGVAGEFYPIKDNIFSEPYEAADDATDAAKAFVVGDFTYDYAGRSATECHRQAAMSDEAEAALWEHMATTIKILQGELADVHKCWDEDLADTRRLRVAAATHATSENYTEEGQAVLVAMAKERDELRVAASIVAKVALWEPATLDEFFDFTDEQRAYLAALSEEQT